MGVVVVGMGGNGRGKRQVVVSGESDAARAERLGIETDLLRSSSEGRAHRGPAGSIYYHQPWPWGKENRRAPRALRPCQRGTATSDVAVVVVVRCYCTCLKKNLVVLYQILVCFVRLSRRPQRRARLSLTRRGHCSTAGLCFVLSVNNPGESSGPRRIDDRFPSPPSAAIPSHLV